MLRTSVLCRVTRVAKNIGLGAGLALASSLLDAQAAPPPGTMVSVPAYRARLLGVYDADSGQPIEGVEVVDALYHASSLTSKTGTVALFFLPDSGSLIRIQKIGYQPTTMVVAISPADTVPITVLLSRVAQALPTVVSKETGRKFFSPGLQAFETRRRLGVGRFITDEELRKSDNRKMTEVLRSAGVTVQCGKRGPPCFAVSNRQSGKTALSIGSCGFDLYLDGAHLADSERDVDKMQVEDYGGIEIYSGAATIPAEYNMTGSSCGVILLWTREWH
jgi:hypothetical protein